MIKSETLTAAFDAELNRKVLYQKGMKTPISFGEIYDIAVNIIDTDVGFYLAKKSFWMTKRDMLRLLGQINNCDKFVVGQELMLPFFCAGPDDTLLCRGYPTIIHRVYVKFCDLLLENATSNLDEGTATENDDDNVESNLKMKCISLEQDAAGIAVSNEKVQNATNYNIISPSRTASVEGTSSSLPPSVSSWSGSSSPCSLTAVKSISLSRKRSRDEIDERKEEVTDSDTTNHRSKINEVDTSTTSMDIVDAGNFHFASINTLVTLQTVEYRYSITTIFFRCKYT